MCMCYRQKKIQREMTWKVHATTATDVSVCALEYLRGLEWPFSSMSSWLWPLYWESSYPSFEEGLIDN